MNKTLNLSELSSQIAKENIQKTDSITAKYLEEVIKHISRRGEKIEDYTLVLVSNPMRLKENNSLTVTMQYRVCRVDELENMPEEDRGAAMTTLSNEQLRHRIVELRQQRGSHLIDESDYIEEVMQLFASQRQAILKEVREELLYDLDEIDNKPWLVFRQLAKIMPEYADTYIGYEAFYSYGGSKVVEELIDKFKKTDGYKQSGFPEEIAEQRVHLDALEKKYKGGEETTKETI